MIMDSQAEEDKPHVEVPEEDASPISEEKMDGLVAYSQTLAIGPALPITGVKRYREPPRKFLTRNRIPFTSEKFDLVGYASKVLRGSSLIYVRHIFKCEFVSTAAGTDFKERWQDANVGYQDKLRQILPRPAIGLIRLVWPSAEGQVHHIIPYLVNGPPERKTIWFLEQYDTTFWWLFNENVRKWHEVVGEAMIGPGNNYIRAYVPAASAISGGTQIKYTSGVAKGLQGYAMDLQKTKEGISAETCVPWSMVILKYIMDPKTIGVDEPQLVLETVNQEDFNKMYETLNNKRDDVLTWVQGTIAGGKRRTRRRRQTRRKTKRSRK